VAGRDWNTRKRLLAGNMFLIAALFLLVTFNKEYLRPAAGRGTLAELLTGCLPNFLAAFLISMAGINGILFRKPVHGRAYAIIFSAAVFIILSFEEFIPIWGASKVFDSFDIAASAVGSILAVAVYELVRHRMLHPSK
jgi:hypothetical protein